MVHHSKKRKKRKKLNNKVSASTEQSRIGSQQGTASNQSPRPRPGRVRSLWQSISPMKRLLGVATLFGAVISYYTLFPRMDIECGDIDSSDPYTTSFVIENVGMLPVYHLKVGCSYLLITYATDVNLYGNPNLILTTAANHLDKLDSHDKRTFLCPKFMTMNRGIYLLPVMHMNLAITAEFTGPALPWKQQSTFRFETVTHKDGTMHWVYSRMQSLIDNSSWPKKQFEIVVTGEPKRGPD